MATKTIQVLGGLSNIYVGEGEMPKGYNVQIDPSGDNSIIEKIIDNSVTRALAGKVQFRPEFINSYDELAESGDTSKLYVLPDGYIYEWKATKFTNLANTSSSDWVTDKYYSSSTAISDRTGAVVSNYLQVTNGDVIRVSGLNIKYDNAGTTAYHRLGLYTAVGTIYGAVLIKNGETVNGNISLVEGDDGIVTMTITSTKVTHVRLCGDLVGDVNDVIITLNEDISKNGSWVNTGHEFIADFSEWNDILQDATGLDSIRKNYHFSNGRMNYMRDDNSADFATEINALLQLSDVLEVYVPAATEISESGELTSVPYTVSQTIVVPAGKTLHLEGDYKTAKSNTAYAVLVPTKDNMNVVELGAGASLIGGHIDLKQFENTNGVYLSVYNTEHEGTRISGSKITGGRDYYNKNGLTKYCVMTQHGVHMQMDDPAGTSKGGWMMFCEFDCDIRYVFSAYHAVRTRGGNNVNDVVWATSCKFYGQLLYCSKYITLDCDESGWQFDKSEIKAMVQCDSLTYSVDNESEDKLTNILVNGTTDKYVTLAEYEKDMFAVTLSGNNLRLYSEMWDFGISGKQPNALLLKESAGNCVIYNQRRGNTVSDLGRNNLFVSETKEIQTDAPYLNSFRGAERTFDQHMTFYAKDNETVIGSIPYINKLTNLTATHRGETFTETSVENETVFEIIGLNHLRGYNVADYVNNDIPATPCVCSGVASYDNDGIYKCVYDIDFRTRQRLEFVGFSTGSLRSFEKISVYLKDVYGYEYLLAEYNRRQIETNDSMINKIYSVPNIYSYSYIENGVENIRNVYSKQYVFTGIKYVMENPIFYNENSTVTNDDKICPLIVPIFYSSSFSQTKQSNRFMGDTLIGDINGAITPTHVTGEDIIDYLQTSGCTLSKDSSGNILVTTKKDSGDTGYSTALIQQNDNILVVADIELSNNLGNYTIMGVIHQHVMIKRADGTVGGMYALSKYNYLDVLSGVAAGTTIATIKSLKVWNLTNETIPLYALISDYYTAHGI